MSNYFISKCCGEQVDILEPGMVENDRTVYICQKCLTACEVTAVDKPGGVPTDYSKYSHTHCWDNKMLVCSIPMHKHTQCCLCDMKVPEDIKAVVDVEEPMQTENNLGKTEQVRARELAELFLDIDYDKRDPRNKSEVKEQVFQSATRLIEKLLAEQREEQKRSIISHIMGMVLVEGLDQVTVVKIINNIRQLK